MGTMHSAPSSPLSLALLATLTLACGPSNASKEVKLGKHQHGSPTLRKAGPLPEAYRQEAYLHHRARAFDYLPDTVLAAGVASSASELAAALELEAILAEYPKAGKELRDGLATTDGAYIFKLSSWAALGLDASAPVGVALYELERRPVLVFFASVTDSELFLKSAEDVLGRGGNPAVRDNAGVGTLLSHPSLQDVALVTRPDVAALIIGSNNEQVDKAARSFLGEGELSPLSGSGKVDVAFSGFDFGDDLQGFVNFEAIAEVMLRQATQHERDDYYQRRIAEIEAQLAVTKASTAQDTELVQEQLKQLDAELRELLKEDARVQLRSTGDRRFAKEVVAALGLVAIGVDLDGPDVRVRAQLSMAATALPRQLLVASPAPIALPSRLKERPAFMFGAHTSTQAVRTLLQIAFAMDGHSLDDFKREAGFALDELLDLSTGEAGVAWTYSPERTEVTEYKEFSSSYPVPGILAYTRLKNEATARTKFAEVVAREAFAKLREGAPMSEALSFEIDGGKKLRVDIRDGLLEGTTPMTPAPTTFEGETKSLLHDRDASAILLIDPSFLGWLFLSRYDGYWYSESGPTASNTDPKTQARIEELEHQLALLRKEQGQAKRERLETLGRQIGRIAVQARQHGTRIAILGHFGGEAPNLGRLLQWFIEADEPALALERTGTPSQVEELRSRIDTLSQELWRLRRGY